MASSKIVKLAVIINNYSDEDKYLLIKQTPPPKFNEEEYNSYVDSDLWDLPSATLNSFQGQFQQSGLLTEGPEYDSTKINLTYFDFESALDQIISQVGFRGRKIGGNWILQKYVEEAEFGPGPPVNTLFISGNLGIEYENPQGVSRWMSIQSCLDLLLEVKPSSDRVGPLIVLGLLNKHVCSEGGFKVSPPLCYQEYPPGITIVPMASKTAKPFYTTNLVIIAPKNATDDSGSSSFAVNGDALIMDPGCRVTCHKELMEIVAALPRKLVVFVTHHHYDHVEGLSIIQKCNPDATLLAHENTIRRIRKDHWSLGYTAISGGEEICIGGQRLNVISAPGHTDGHMALHHVRTHSLIVGDHCVGQGSAILDIESGGNLKDYFETTYKFLDLSPHVLIPMHGRVNLWPKNMLCKYLKNRRSRESAVLKAIQNGAETLFDIVAKVYSDVNPSFWIPASSNVRIHVEHLVQEGVLPEEFSIQKFQKSCRLQFIWRWAWVFVKSSVAVQYQKQSRTNLFSVSAVVMGIAMFYVVKPKLISK